MHGRTSVLLVAIGLLLSAAAHAERNTTSPRNADPFHQSVTFVSPSLSFGPEPRTAGDFATLAGLRVTTIVSVDGARPRVDAADEHGLRYVHVPVGYDGLPLEARLALTRVAREQRGGIYVHCHHGKHRGPAAAAVVARALGMLPDDKEVTDLLTLAGTDPRFVGLWRDATVYRPPPADAVLPQLVGVAKVDPFVSAMAQADRAIDRIDRRAADREEAVLLLRESMREANRAARAQEMHRHNPQLIDHLTTAEAIARRVDKESTETEFRSAVEQMRAACIACHERFRD